MAGVVLRVQYCILVSHSALKFFPSHLIAGISSRVWGRDGRKLGLDGASGMSVSILWEE